jgi:hypothetical protein
LQPNAKSVSTRAFKWTTLTALTVLVNKSFLQPLFVVVTFQKYFFITIPATYICRINWCYYYFS